VAQLSAADARRHEKKAIRAEIRFLNEQVKKAGWSSSLTIVSDGTPHYGDDEDLDEGSERLVVDDSQTDGLLQRIELECRLAACITLTPIERRIVEARLNEDYPTLRELAAELDLSHQRVHQLEHSAFEKIVATKLPLSDLVMFYIRPTKPVDDWLDAITTHFYAAPESWLTTRLQLLVMHWLADFGREDHEPQPLGSASPKSKNASGRVTSFSLDASSCRRMEWHSTIAGTHRRINTKQPKRRKNFGEHQRRTRFGILPRPDTRLRSLKGISSFTTIQ
jgi:hypothetical protein